MPSVRGCWNNDRHFNAFLGAALISPRAGKGRAKWELLTAPHRAADTEKSKIYKGRTNLLCVLLLLGSLSGLGQTRGETRI